MKTLSDTTKASSALDRDEAARLVLPKYNPPEYLLRENAQLRFVTDRPGSLPPSPPTPSPAPASPPSLTPQLPSGTTSPEVAKVGEDVRNNLYLRIDAINKGAEAQMKSLTVDLILGPGAHAKAEENYARSLKAVSTAAEGLEAECYKGLDDAKREILATIKASGGVETDPTAQAIFKDKIRRVVGVKTDDTLPAWPAVWNSESVETFVIAYKGNVRLVEGRYLSIDEVAATLLSRKEGSVAGSMKVTFGKAVAKILNDFEVAKIEKAETDRLLASKKSLIDARVNNSQDTDPQIVQLRNMRKSQDQALHEAIQIANGKLTSIGLPPVSQADITTRFAPPKAVGR